MSGLAPALPLAGPVAVVDESETAVVARVPLRVHAEHGWDAHDPQGRNPRYQRLRKLYRPFVSHQVAVSGDLARYLNDAVGVPADGVSLYANRIESLVRTGKIYNQADVASRLEDDAEVVEDEDDKDKK